jgi:cob(I)alamin adenosyltransferase
MEKGYVHVYTGDGKGKTTAMLGLALRACGAGLKVYIGQFIKHGEYSEIKAIRKYLPGVTVEQYGRGFILSQKASEEDIESARNGFMKVVDAVFSGEYDVVMLDEINMAVHYGLVSIEELIGLIKGKPIGVELVLTGRGAKDELIEAADLVSEVYATKHYYTDGIMAREGIEK